MNFLTSKSTAALRMELAQLRARYDDGAVAPAIYIVIRTIETDISWIEHQRRCGHEKEKTQTKSTRADTIRPGLASFGK